jgi:Mn-dependent DtxR family transcriptional regulator
VDIAEALGIRQPSVTAMVQKLGQAGYLNYEKYRGLTLTAKGRAVATAIRERHDTLQRFFTVLNVSAATQERDIEGIEHCLSPETLAALAALADYFEATPAAAREMAKFARKASAVRSH